MKSPYRKFDNSFNLAWVVDDNKQTKSENWAKDEMSLDIILIRLEN